MNNYFWNSEIESRILFGTFIFMFDFIKLILESEVCGFDFFMNQ